MLYQKKLQQQDVQDIVNRNKIKFEPYYDLVYQAFSQFDDNSNQELHGEIENNESPEAEHPNENDLEDTKTNKTSAIPIFMPQVLSDGGISKGINSLTAKQREVFNMVHTWAKDYVKYDGRDVESVHIFLSSSGRTGKFHLVKVAHNALTSTLHYHCEDSEKSRVFFTWNYRNISSKYRWNHHSFLSWNQTRRGYLI